MSLVLNDEQEKALREWWAMADKLMWADTSFGYVSRKLHESLGAEMGRGKVRYFWHRDGQKDIVDPLGRKYRVSGGGIGALIESLNESEARK